jgi:hypothetical protein
MMSDPIDWTAVRNEPLGARPAPVIDMATAYPNPVGTPNPRAPRRRTLPVIGATSLAVVLAAAAGGYLATRSGPPAAPAAAASTPTPAASPSTAPSPTPTPATSTAPNAPTIHRPGDTVTDDIATATYYSYKQPAAANAPRPATDGYTWAAIDIKLCITGGTDPTVETTAIPWQLHYADDTTADASNIEYNQFPAPRYHFSNVIAKGSCLRGWLTFAVPPGKRPVTVEYTPMNLVFDWSI